MKIHYWVSLALPFLVACSEKSVTDEQSDKNNNQVLVVQESTKKNLHWKLNSLSEFNGLPFVVEGDVSVVDDSDRAALRFDGDEDRLLVSANPLALLGLSTDAQATARVNSDAFTVEVLIKPYATGPEAREPRFFHIESASNPLRRLTIEMRLNDTGEWWLDSFIKTDNASLVLIDESLKHPAGQWAHVAVTYGDGVLTSYVNGVKELSGEIDYLPIPDDAKTSIGGRMNRVNWFDGEISDIAITNQALVPEAFTLKN